MIINNLFEEILIGPSRQGADRLLIVSGYATATLASRHLEELSKLRKNVKTELIYGMFPQGNTVNNHLAFQTLSAEDYPTKFECYYPVTPPPIHAKCYAWLRNDEPFVGFMGSANYSQNAFGRSQREAMTIADPMSIVDYFYNLKSQTIDCRDAENEGVVIIPQKRESTSAQRPNTTDIVSVGKFEGLRHVKISLLDYDGTRPETHFKSFCLNWGILNNRPSKDEAYIRVPSRIARTDFFPPIAQHFTVLTDDDKIIISSRAQEKIGKAIHSPHDNKLIGLYFRNRLNKPSGSYISAEDLLHYGRTDVDFYKIDDETYIMDFSPPN